MTDESITSNDSMNTNSDNLSEQPQLNRPKIDFSGEDDGSIIALKDEYAKYNCSLSENDLYSKDCNTFLLKKELLESEKLGEQSIAKDDYLYPTLNDPNFSLKIAEKKEFNDTQYDGEIMDIKKKAKILSDANFEMAPHQIFVRNFLSFQTPYNSLLLFHGLGSGKTLSAIGVCEEMRDYLKQIGSKKKIIIVASPNVQYNFRTQLFDERKMLLVDGLWTIRDAIANKFIQEVNPMQMKGLTKERVISQVNKIINDSYVFLGYIEFANYIEKVQTLKGEYKTEKQRQSRMEKNLQYEFDNRLLVIDEVHNIRVTDDTENKKVGEQLLRLVKAANNMRLLLLSATPMFNNYKEIVWLLNLMNINDRRGIIQVKDVFDKYGDFKIDGDGKEVGKEVLIRKANGYISFVRGENPYTFPFRIFPNTFAPDHTFDSLKFRRPVVQMNGKPMESIADENEETWKALNLYLLKVGDYQKYAYKYVIESLKQKRFSIVTADGKERKMPSFENMNSFGYVLLQLPLQTLIMSYPVDGLEEIDMSSTEVVEEVKENVEEGDDDEDLQVEAALDTKLGEPEKETVTLEEKETIKNSDSDVEEVVESKSILSDDEGKEIVLTKKPSSEQSISSFEYESDTEDSKKGGQGKTSGINANDVTGLRGLERTMDFVDTKTPPVKGQFEYKDNTLKKYGRIFSPSEIGKYSSKIKNVCDNIVNSKGYVSKGIILIYSQWIDGGLIPMALALEEMGFQRFGQNAKSLFKTPVAPVDVRTMKSRKKGLIPAKYAMITGDPRLSPNNNYELKAITSEDNIDGERVKVVLISKAGSEGLDFKFLRQIHILEPWYNTNRIEQTIGRGVRNFSHRSLPFEERNVEIFLYGIILDDEREESADLYVYRGAEKKAKTIGQVTRVLKETAVDCILNYEQSNYSQKMIQEMLGDKGAVEQQLSNGMVIKDFHVGDVPYSAACDYMDNCEYKCYSDKKIDDIKVNDFTYNEAFIMMNADKIIEKIRELFTERYFFTKSDLITRVNTPRPYPIVQIYAALTHIIEDSTQFLLDKYGRTGYLVNIGEYYLFQPSELNNRRISLFDREVPIDYKHSNIKITLEKRKLGAVDDELIETENVNVKEDEIEQKIEKQPTIDATSGETIIKDIDDKLKTAILYGSGKKSITHGDDDWYKHCGLVMVRLKKRGISETILYEFFVSHIIDIMMFKEKLYLLRYIFSLPTIKDNSLEHSVKKYFEKYIINSGSLKGFIMFDITKRVILKLEGNNWVKSEPEDEREITESALIKFSVKGKTFNPIVGFIGLTKNKDDLVFKTKKMSAQRNTGARCDDSVKSKKIQILNEIDKGDGEKELYTKESTRGMGQAELCALIEFLLRYKSYENTNLIAFLNYEISKLYNF